MNATVEFGGGGAAAHIRRLQPDELGLVEPLWSALRLHHASVAPEWGPPRSREDSWSRRRSCYEEWLADQRSFGLLAVDDGGSVVGYSIVQILKESSTWQLGERGEIETLSVMPAARGRGIGTQLVAAVCAELRAIGVTLLGLQVVAGNTDALRFYERHGLLPALVTLHGNV